MPTGTTVIKKYPNRRLYDTSASKYINLDDIAVMVREGKELQVVDVQTGEDLTRVTLTQIIMEDAKQQPTGLPLELLRQLIVSSDRMGREFIMWYLKSAYDAYQTVQSKLTTGLHDVQAAAISPVNMVKSFLQSQVPMPPKPAAPPSSESEELRQLRQRLADLEARLAAPARRAPAKRTASKKSKPGRKRKGSEGQR